MRCLAITLTGDGQGDRSSTLAFWGSVDRAWRQRGCFGRLRREALRPDSQLVLRNRGAGPFGLLNVVDERCGGTFDNIDDVIRPEERVRFMAAYRTAAGFAMNN